MSTACVYSFNIYDRLIVAKAFHLTYALFLFFCTARTCLSFTVSMFPISLFLTFILFRWSVETAWKIH